MSVTDLYIGMSVTIRCGPYGDTRDTYFDGVIIAGPVYPRGGGEEWRSWRVRLTPRAAIDDGLSFYFTEGFVCRESRIRRHTAGLL